MAVTQTKLILPPAKACLEITSGRLQRTMRALPTLKVSLLLGRGPTRTLGWRTVTFLKMKVLTAMPGLSSLVSFLFLLPSIAKARISRFAYSSYQKVRPTIRAPFKGFSDSGEMGINLAGYLRAETGLGQAARGMAAALEAAQVPFSVANLETGNYARHTNTSYLHKENRQPRYDITILVINPDNIANAKLWLPKALFAGRYVIGYWVWELPEIPDDWSPVFRLVDEVWAASRFVEKALKAKSPVPISRIPHVVTLPDTRILPRPHFSLPQDQFLFLTMCDASSVTERKNPRAAVRAFQKAFARNDSRVGLVLKIREQNPFRRDLSALRQDIAGWPNIYLLGQAMSRQEVDSLLAGSDCLVSLHRSEGFGLAPAEAMSLGKPAIMTRWSGNTDYMTPDNSVGIDYRLIKLQRDYGPYKAGQVWADPNINQAAAWMKRLAEDRNLAKAIGIRGQETIQQELSPGVVGSLIRKRLLQIREQYRGGR